MAEISEQERLQQQPNVCPIWETRLLNSANKHVSFRIHVDSPRAGGAYSISRQSAYDLLNQGQFDQHFYETRVGLTNWLNEQRKSGVSIPAITPKVIEDAPSMRGPSITERADEILRFAVKHTQFLGRSVDFQMIHLRVGAGELTDAKKNYLELLAYSGCADNSDFKFLLRYLETERLIRYSHVKADGLVSIIVDVPGYQRREKIDQVGAESTQAFVAMWFHPSTLEAYEKGIEPAILDAGYKPLRIDRKDHNNRIDDEIIAEIRRSRFVVADFTQDGDRARGGVYYEAGFAHGLALPVIFTCRQDVIDKGLIHLDTRQYNHIAWTTPEELRKQLVDRIAATIGDGPQKG